MSKVYSFSDAVIEKLRSKHNVTVREVEQSSENRTGSLLEDSREAHKTIPPTRWFLSYTNRGRLLKVVYIQIGGRIHIKSGFPPMSVEIEIYEKHGNWTAE